VMLDYWGDELPGGQPREFKVLVINDLYNDWKGDVHLRVTRDGNLVAAQGTSCTVAALGSETLSFTQSIPAEPGEYVLTAELTAAGQPPVRSVRDAKVVAAK